MHKSILIGCLLFFLTGCGGGSSGNGYANLTNVIKDYPSDGSAVATTKIPVNYSYGYVNAVMFLADPKDANKIADALQRANNGQLTLVSPDTIAGSNYSERQQGISSTGEAVDMIYYGTSLSDGGFVSSGVTQVASAIGISVDGSALISRPASGTFTYNGSSTIYGASNDLGESGTMNVVADFGNKTASLTLKTATAFATANNLSINLTTGSLDGHGLIGQTGISSDAATIKGYFAGRSAEGVYGTVFQKADVTNSKAATFYGTK